MARLEAIQEALAKRGLTDFVREVAIDVWRANRARYEPDELFDDSFTLSVLSSRNLANRLSATIRADGAWRAAGVSATRDFTATVLKVDGIDVRLIKTPYSSGRRPNFVADFDWTASESRLAAAARNRERYSPPVRQPEMDPLFEMESPDTPQACVSCRDAFLVWCADLTSGLTAGWLGLPTTSPNRWLAVSPLWWDEPAMTAASIRDDQHRADGASFEARTVPVPSITLKPRQVEGKAR